MRELARQGTAMARVAHLFATLMVVLFSLGSLVALSGESFSAIVATLRQGGVPGIPEAISIAVSTLMVVCCDIGLVYAAMTLRVLQTRGADEGRVLHWAVLVGVSAIEAGTYLYMSAAYERPAGWAWALVIARALAAPLLSVYLAMARAHPVTPRDILHQAELAQGVQLVRDVIRVAQDSSASLADKMRLYEASAEMGARDRERLGQMIAVVRSRLDGQGEQQRGGTGDGADAPVARVAVVEDAAHALLVAPTGRVALSEADDHAEDTDAAGERGRQDKQTMVPGWTGEAGSPRSPVAVPPLPAKLNRRRAVEAFGQALAARTEVDEDGETA
jgi:hypothetical protein